MRYMLLIYQDASAHADWSEEQNAAHFEEYRVLTEEMLKQGIMEAGNPLMLAIRATTVRVRNGETLTTKGPFAETKEQLGGYYLINCKDLDEAIAIAAKLPTAADPDGCIEIRPIIELG